MKNCKWDLQTPSKDNYFINTDLKLNLLTNVFISYII